MTTLSNLVADASLNGERTFHTDRGRLPKVAAQLSVTRRGHPTGRIAARSLAFL
jgi:hypothetical protein